MFFTHHNPFFILFHLLNRKMLGVSWSQEFAKGWESVSSTLSQYGIHRQNTAGATALQHALWTKNSQWVTAIVTHPEWSREISQMHYTPFHCVVNSSRVCLWEPETETIFCSLLDAACNPDQRDMGNRTIMDIVTSKHCVYTELGVSPVLRMLLKRCGIHSLFDSFVPFYGVKRSMDNGPYCNPPVVTLTGPDVHPTVAAFVEAEVAAFKTEFFRVTDIVFPVRDVATLVYRYIVPM